MKTSVKIQFDFSDNLSGWWLITEAICVRISQQRALEAISIWNMSPDIDFENMLITYDNLKS